MNNLIFLFLVLVILAVAIFICFKTEIHISDKVYDRLKWVGEKFCPALNVFILAITKIYNVPGGIEAAGFVAAFQVFLLALVCNANDTYKATSAEDLQKMAEQKPGYIGERFYTDDCGNLLEEVCDES